MDTSLTRRTHLHLFSLADKLQTACTVVSSFHIFGNQEEKRVLRSFVISIVIVFFRAITLQVVRNSWT